MGGTVARAIDHPHLGGPDGREAENPIIAAVTIIQRLVHLVDVEVDGAIEDAGNVVAPEQAVVAGRHLIPDIENGVVGADALGDGVHGGEIVYGHDKCFPSGNMKRGAGALPCMYGMNLLNIRSKGTKFPEPQVQEPSGFTP